MDGQNYNEQQPDTPWQFKPGDTVSPNLGQPAPTAAEPPNQVASPVVEVEQPAPPVAYTEANTPEPQPAISTANAAYQPPVNQPPSAAPQMPAADPPVYPDSVPQPAITQPAVTPDTQVPAVPAQAIDNQPPAPALPSTAPAEESINWTASEFIAHHKTQGWYALLMLAACVAALLVWLVTRDLVSTAVVIVAGAVLATFAARKPRELSYYIGPAGLSIGERRYSFSDFRSFSVVPEGAFSSIVFTPLKRFGVLTTIYFDPQDEARIVDIVSHRLPHEQHHLDAVDGLMRRIRF